LSVAELYFKNKNYTQAKKHFEYINAHPGRFDKAQTLYRMAWCDYNNGQIKEAVKTAAVILRSPNIKTQFAEEVSRDLVVFLGHQGAGLNEAKLIYELSPKDKKLDHVFYLANEVERLGQKQNSLAVWNYLLAQDIKPMQRLEGIANIAQIEITEHNYTDGAKTFAKAAALWAESCKDKENNCEAIKSKLRNTLAGWYVVAKKYPHNEIYAVSEAYFKTFGHDWEMSYQLAAIAREQKAWQKSYDLHQKALALALEKKVDAAKIEVILLNQLEMSEGSKDESLLKAAIENYLEKSPKQAKHFEVAYKKAHLIYKAQDYKQAAEAMRTLALANENGPAELKEKAADLALDSLVVLKDDEKLETWSKEFALKYPQKAAEFKAIANKSILNQSAALAKDSSHGAYAKLLTVDVKELAEDERVTVYKNRIVLAEKNKDFADARATTDLLLAQKNLSSADKEFALTHRGYLAELAFDFKTALNVAKELPEKKEENKLLKLALFAELAKVDPYTYYNSFLLTCKDKAQAKAIALNLIKTSTNQLNEIQKQKRFLKDDPNLLGDLYVNALAKSQSESKVNEVLRDKDIQTAPGRLTLWRTLWRKEFMAERARLTNHKLNSTTNKKLALTIKERIALLSAGEKLIKKTVEANDFISQLLALDMVANEANRFYEDLLALPLPDGLTPEEQQNYLGLLAQKANPHKSRSTELKNKVQEFWNNTKAFNDLKVALESSSLEVRNFVGPDLKLLAEVAPADKKNLVQAALDVKGTTAVAVNAKEIESARQVVREDPMNLAKLENLLSLEKAAGTTPMVVYLENRLESLKKVVQ
jgi:hypothetical protein